MPEEPTPTTDTSTTAPVKAAKRPMTVSVDVLLLLILMLGTGYVGWSSWNALNPAEDALATPVATPTPTPEVPELTLNETHERQAPTVTVNPDTIGKPDPFRP